MLVISDRSRASRSSDFEITRAITPWIVLHSVQLLFRRVFVRVSVPEYKWHQCKLWSGKYYSPKYAWYLKLWQYIWELFTSCALRQVPTRQNCFASGMCESLTDRWNYFTIDESRKGRVWRNSDRRLGLKGIIFITFLKCGMLREYYLSSKQYLAILKHYLRFTGCSSIVWINVYGHINFRFIFFLFNQEKINTTTQSDDISIITNVGKETKCHSKATLPEWFSRWTQKSLLMFRSIASETELSKPFWCICWWVIYRTTTSVDLVIFWLHCEQMEWLVFE